MASAYAEAKARAVCKEMDTRMRAKGVVTTIHYDVGESLIAAAIDLALEDAILRSAHAAEKGVRHLLEEPYE